MEKNFFNRSPLEDDCYYNPFEDDENEEDESRYDRDIEYKGKKYSKKKNLKFSLLKY